MTQSPYRLLRAESVLMSSLIARKGYLRLGRRGEVLFISSHSLGDARHVVHRTRIHPYIAHSVHPYSAHSVHACIAHRTPRVHTSIVCSTPGAARQLSLPSSAREYSLTRARYEYSLTRGIHHRAPIRHERVTMADAVRCPASTVGGAHECAHHRSNDRSSQSTVVGRPLASGGTT